jgi:hypothetical protein
MIDVNAVQAALNAAGNESGSISAAQIAQEVQTQGLNINPAALEGFIHCVIKNAPYAPIFTLVCECAADNTWTAPKGSTAASVSTS